MGRPGAGAPGLAGVASPVFESPVAGPPGTHARGRAGAGQGYIGGNRPPAGHRTGGQGLAVGPAAALGGSAGLVGVARAGAARTATPGPGGLGRGLPPGAALAAIHRLCGAGTAPTGHLWGARGGGMQARLHPGHDRGQLGDGAFAAASAASRGHMDRGAGPEASHLGFGGLPLLRGPLGDGGPSPVGGGPSPDGLPAMACTAGRLAPAGADQGGAFAGAGPPVGVAGVPAGNGPAAGGVGMYLACIYGMYLAVLSARMGAKSRHVETRARAPRSLRSRADALPMRAGATHGGNWARAHTPRGQQQRR